MSPPPKRPARATYQRPQVNVRPWRGGEPRLVVIHESRVLGAGLEEALGGRARILYHTLFGAAAVPLAEVFTPEVVVAGDFLADGPLESHLAALLRTGTRVIAVTEQSDARRAVDLLHSGCSGVADWSDDVSTVAESALAVGRGGAVIPPAVAELLLSDWRVKERPVTDGRADRGLTDRELEVLTAMADGMATKAIARRLNMAAKTAENHKTRIFQKLGVRGQAEAIALLHRSGDEGSVAVRRPPGEKRQSGLI